MHICEVRNIADLNQQSRTVLSYRLLRLASICGSGRSSGRDSRALIRSNPHPPRTRRSVVGARVICLRYISILSYDFDLTF